ncbi:MAG: potassium transporter [Chitinophagales bacterium]|nr:potassium transporter [Chitinophagales bacterium]
MGFKTSRLEEERNRKDDGFGTNATNNRVRMIRADGSFNVRRKGQSFGAWFNIFHRLTTMKALPFIAIVAFTYFIVNLLFAMIYYIIGTEFLNGIQSQTNYIHPFWSAFFFSSQTLTTVGYGHISPIGMITNGVAAVESLLGLMMFAIITGLLYGRFSRPTPKIKFSNNIIIAPYLDINGLMFRLINERNNQLINVKADVSLSRNEVDSNGKTSRKYYNLSLERELIKFFATSWTVVHPITEDSPLYQATPKSIAESDTEILIAIEGINDTYADPVHVRMSYLYKEFLWSKKFVPILSDEDNTYIVDINKIDDMIDAPLNSY